MEQLIQFLHSVYPLPEALQDHLRSIIKFRTIKRNGFLLRAGHYCRDICFIQKGILRCYYEKGDVNVSSWFMKEGDIVVSVESFFQQQPSYESIQALEESELFYIDYNELQFIYRNFPEFNFIGRVLTERYYILWAQQLRGLRMQRATERYQWLLDHHASLALRVPAKYLASWLDITEVMLSKIKGKMQFS